MPYIGRDLNRGNYLKLDDISSSFNGNTKTFNLTSGGTAFIPGSSLSILVSVGGVILEPETAYQINNSEITFTTAPSGSDNFFCIVLGVALGVNTVANGTVNGAQVAKPFNYDNYFNLDSTNNRVGIGSLAPTSTLDIIGDVKVSGNITGSVNTSSGISTFYDLRVTNDLTVEGTTTTLDTVVTEVDKLEVAANNTTVGVAITQSGTGYGLYVDGTSVFGNTQLLPSLGAGTKAVAADLSGNGNWVDFTIFGGRTGRSLLNFGDHDDQDVGAIKYYHSDNSLNFTTNGSTTERLTIASDGKVGINSTAPTHDLDVNGTSQFQDDVTFTTQNGNNVVLDKSTNGLDFGDNVSLRFGESDDLVLYHDQSVSRIIDSYGHLLINSNLIELKSNTGNKSYFSAVNGSHTKLFYNGNEKFATSGVGVTVFGTVVTDALSVNTSFPAIYLYDTTADANDYRITNSDGTLKISDTTDSSNILHRFQISSDGDIISGIGSVSIGLGAIGQRKVDIITGDDNGVLIRPTTAAEGSEGSADSIQDLIQLRNPWGSSAHNTGNAGARFGIQMRAYNGAGDFNTKDPAKSAAIYAVSEDEFSGYWKNVGLAFYTSAYNQSQAEKVRIDTNGNVGINSSNPQAKLDVHGVGIITGGIITNVSPAITIRDGTTEKGYIGFNANDPFIGRKNGVGLLFQDNKVRPVDGDDGSGTNNTVSLGEPTYKFKDLYLEGDIHIDSDVGQLRIGADEDLKIDHNGSNAYFMNGTGSTLNRAANHVFENGDGSTEYVRIKSDGKVGIGTNNPDEKLHVYNGAGDVTSFVEAIAGDALLNLSNSGNGNYSGINFIRERGSGQTGRNGGAIFMPSNTANNEAYLYIQAQSTSAQAGVTGALSANNGVRLKLHGDDGIFSIETGASERLRIDENGKVGIGTDNPSQLIDVFKTTNDAVIKTRTTGAGAYFEADSASTTAGYHGLSLSSSGTEKWFVGSYNSHNFHIKDGRRNDGDERFTIKTGTGNVGIGTNNPDELLHILSNTSNSKIVLESDNNAANNGIFWVDEGNNTQTEFYYSHPDNKQLLKVNGNGFEIYSKQQNNVIAKIGHGTGYNDMILSNGNFGIGTDDPAAKIEAFGNDAGIIVHNYGHSRGGIAGFTNQRVGFVATSNNDDLIFGYSNNPPSTANLVERMRIDNGTGKVGIMTSSPDSRLTVAGTSATAQIELKRLNSNATGTVGALNFTAFDGHSVANISAVADGDNEGAHLVFRTTSAAGELSPFGGSTKERLRITSDGEVGIGIDDPDAQLDIFKFTNTSGSSGTTMLRLTNHVGSASHNGDIHSPLGQQTFIDFRFTDGNATFTPQVRIGAQAGNTEGDAGIESEGMGSFVVYTGKGTDSSGGGALTEKLRVTPIGSLGLNNTNPKARVDFGYDSGQNSHAFVQFKGPNNKSGEMLHKYVFNGSTGNSQVVNLLEVTSWQSTNSRIFGVVKVMAVHPLSNHGNQHEGWFFKADDGSADTGAMSMVHSKGGSVGSLDWDGDTLRYTTPASSYLNMHISVEYHIYDGGTVVFDTSSRNF